MVFESVVVELLNRYLKPYVKKLDTSQLKVAVWKGHASLDKLELKEDLFAEADLDVPLKIKRSFIGKLEMQIPWKRLTKDPLVIMIDEIYVILEPNIETKFDPVQDMEHQRREKEKKIEKFRETLKNKKRMERESKKGKKKKESEKPDTFVEKLAVHLTKNLQVVVRDIHVRYEDSVTKPGTTMAAGATLHSLEVKSTDGNWVPSVVRETATVIYKLVELNCLGLYWNSGDQSIASMKTSTMIEEMKSTIARPSLVPPPCNAYFLSPVTATAKLKMNVKIEGDLSMPQLVGGVDCGDLLFTLQQEQLKALLTTVEFFERYKVNKKYLKYRPCVSVREDRKSWWRYAITAMLEEDVKRRTRMWSWTHMQQHRNLCVRYQMKYHEKLHSHSISASLKEELQWLEDRMDWFNIIICRKAAAKKLTFKSGPRTVSQQSPPTSDRSGPDPSSSSLSSLSEDPQRRVIYSSGSKEAKREEKMRKEEEKVAKSAANKQRGKDKMDKKTSTMAFFSKLKSKVKSSSKKKGGVAEGRKTEGALSNGGTSGNGASGGGGVRSEEGAARNNREWEIVLKEEADLLEVVEDLEEEDEEAEKAREQLYKDIGYMEDDELKYPKEYVGHEFHLKVNSFTLELLGKTSKIGHLVTEKIAVDLLHRPATSAFSVSTSVCSMVMQGVPHEGRTTTLVTSLVGLDSKEQLVNLQLDVNPIHRPGMDITVKASLRPIQITYDFETVNALVEMFKPPKLLHFQELTQAASASWEELKSQTSDSLRKAVRDRKQLELDITLQSPFLVLPENGCYTEDVNLVVADLGKLSVYGSTSDFNSASIKTRTDALEKCYDTFTIKLDGMQIMVARPGEDWRGAMLTPGSSTLHILDPSGFQISLLKSIVSNDAYLPSLRVEGSLPGFDVKISDLQLASLIKVVRTLEKPPALITITDAYDALPTSSNHLALNSMQMTNLEAFSLETISSSVFDVEEEEEEEEEDESLLSLRSNTSPTGTAEEGDKTDITARHVFTDVSIKLTVHHVSLELTQTQTLRKLARQKTRCLLAVVITEINADVVDRKWDMQGAISIKGVAIFDHMTLGTDGKPSYLLKTEALTDGNFVSTRFVMVTRLGVDFAAKYTGLQDTVSVQLSLVTIALHQETLAALIQYAMKVLSAIKQSDSVEEPQLMERTDAEEVSPVLIESVINRREDLNTEDITVNKTLDLHFDVKFEGIGISLQQNRSDIADINVKGFLINGRAQTKEITVDVNIKDVSVMAANCQRTPYIVEKADEEKDIVSLKVVQYNHPSYERDPNNMEWMDTSLRAEIGGVNVYVDTSFLAKILKFGKDLNVNDEVIKSAAVATAETATATATTIAESRKSSHRVKLDVLFHAPQIYMPYITDSEKGTLCIDLGGFRLSNKFVHALTLESKVMETMSILSSRIVMDSMEIQTTSIHIYRQAIPLLPATLAEKKRYVILEPIEFMARINRNISTSSELYPNVDIVLEMDSIQFHLHENDIQAFLSLGKTAVEMVSVLTTPPSKPQAPKHRAQSLAHPLKKRNSSLFTAIGSRPRSTTSAVRTATSKRHVTHDGKVIVEVRLSALLKSVTVEFSSIVAPLFNFTAMGMKTDISVFKTRLDVSGSVDSLSLVDLGTAGSHSKVLSLAEHTNKVSSLDLTVSLDKDASPMMPLGSVNANIAQLRMVILIPFVLQIVKFIQRLKFDPSMFKNVSKVAQGGATAVTTMASDKYFNVEVAVHAPVLILPISETSRDGFMVDLGSLAVRNTLLIPDQSLVQVGVDAYGIKLDSFKISRVLLDNSKTDCSVLAERVLLQPFHMLLALERNLCSWYNQVPTLSVNLTMGELAVFLGQEDLERAYKFGTSISEQIITVLSNTSQPTDGEGEDTPADVQPPLSTQTSGDTSYEKFRVISSLPQFELKLFKGEPSLETGDEVSQNLSRCEAFALVSLKLVTMELKTIVSSQSEVNVQASMKDISLMDELVKTKKRNTGNRVIQHYTSNPLHAFTGKIEKPLFSIQYLLRTDQEHIIVVGAQDLLVLSDVEFMSMVANYLRAIFDPKVNMASLASEAMEETVKEGQELSEASSLESTTLNLPDENVPDEKTVSKRPSLWIKCQVSVTNFRVAVIEDVYTENPQALTLRVSSHVYLKLSEICKDCSLTLSDLSVATSSFYDLENTTSWVLLPCTIQLSMAGPPDLPAMNISGSVDPVCLTLSPSIVRLIIHAVKTLLPEKVVKTEESPRNLWMKQIIGSKYWFLQPVVAKRLPKSLPEASLPKDEKLLMTIESVEIILENEGTSKSAAYPVVALNCSAIIQLFEWTGELAVSGDLQVEATFFNQHLSLWEPLLETLEKEGGGSHRQWDLQIKAGKAPPMARVENSDADLSPKPDFHLEMGSTSPLQLTLTKTSLQLIKDLVDSYKKEYGKQVEGDVKIQTLTGAPYTVINKLGMDTSLFVQPGPTLKLIGHSNYAMVANEGTLSLTNIKAMKMKSYTSLLAHHTTEESTIDIAVGMKLRPVKDVAVDNPGLFHYTLVPKESYGDSVPSYGVVVDVTVTGTKKTIIIRSPIQFTNHLLSDIDILSLDPGKKDPAKEVITVLKTDHTFQVPIYIAQSHSFFVRPTGFGYTPVGKPIMWQQRSEGEHLDLKCVAPEDESLCFYSKVVFREEKYKVKRNLQKEADYPHYIFHIYPPLIIQNLLPYKIFIDAKDSGCPFRELNTGQSIPIHELDLSKYPEMKVTVIEKKSVGMKGKFNIRKKMAEYVTFPTVAMGGATPTQLTLHSEDVGSLKVAIYSSIWVINKTGLNLEYKEGNKVTVHPYNKDTALLSTSNSKSKIQLRARSKNNTFTEWTKTFAVNAVGTSGNFCAKLGENVYQFGVEVWLSQFALTKMVMITPYYLLVNKTKKPLHVYEHYNVGMQTEIPAGEVVPFWTMNDSNKLVVVAGDGKKSASAPFNFKGSDNLVLQFDDSNEILALCVEIQESESANIITFSPYYLGCVPLLVINHFPDLSLRFSQITKGGAVIHTISARESLYYTWDNPLGKKVIQWNFPAAKVHNRKAVNVTKDCEGKFGMTFDQSSPALSVSVAPSILQQNASEDLWVEVDESFSEQLVVAGEDEYETSVMDSLTSDLSSITKSSGVSISGGATYKGYWKSFVDGIQRVLLFTPDDRVLVGIRIANSFSIPKFEASLSLKAIGLSLVDNRRKLELAYISVQPSCVIWQLEKGKKKHIWKTLNNSVIALLEQAYLEEKREVRVKNLAVNLEAMKMYSPLQGKLRRTHYEGINVKFTMSESDFSLHAKIGYVQIDNQLPFSVYPQLLYPLPPPPTVASTTEPKPFVELSVILKKPDQSNVIHFKYIHVLVQKMSVNADLGFILSLVDFFSIRQQDASLEEEYVLYDMEYASKSLLLSVVPELADDIRVSRLYFDVLHLAPIKINLSFNIRSLGKNKGADEMSVGHHFLHLFLDSIGVILTSVQDIEMKFSLFHLEFQPQTGKGLGKLMIKHYRNQALFELYTLIFGLDVLGNPVSVVRGVVIGAKDLFYEPFKGSVLGPEEFFQGLGLGLRSFLGAGVVGGLTGAGARITGAFGDVFAKLSFDDDFIDQRQQTKAKPPKMGWKLGNFAKNVVEGVTGVVTQPVKGMQKDGALGLLKGTGKGLVGLLVRPTGGLVDLASGTLEFVTRKTKVGTIEISDVRPPRFIGRDGVIHPYSAQKAFGTALLRSVDEGAFVDTDYYVGHVQVQLKPIHFFVVTDRRMLLIERKILTEGWTAFQSIGFHTFESTVEIKDVTVIIKYSKEYQDRKFKSMSFKTEETTKEIGRLINQSYMDYLND